MISVLMPPVSTSWRASFSASFAGQLGEALARAIHQLALDLHGRQQRLAHRLDRHVLDDVQQCDLRAVAGGDGLGPLADHLAVVGQVDDQQNFLVVGHRALPVKPMRRANSANAPRPKSRRVGGLRRSSRASCAASAANPAAGTVSARAPGSMPAARISSWLSSALSALRKVLRRCENAAATTFA